MLTMTPPPWAIICLPAHLQPRKTPFRLMPTTVFQPLIEMSFPMPVPPPVTIAVLPSRENGLLAMAGTIPQRAGDVYGPGGAGASHGRLAPGRPVSVRSHLLPVARLLEGLSRAVDGRLV